MTKIPRGKNHIKMIDNMIEHSHSKTQFVLKEYDLSMELIGTSLSALYEAATCHRRCNGGNHVLEALSGRIYNLGLSSYSLLRIGLYDESLNLIRSIGEISNLIALSVVDPEAIQEWLKSDKKTRIKKFSPSAIRKQLSKENFVIAGEDWYSEFCEKFTHATPETRPGNHGDKGAFVGSIVSKEGIEKVIDELEFMLFITAVFICRFFKFEDLLSELEALIPRLKETVKKANSSLKQDT